MVRKSCWLHETAWHSVDEERQAVSNTAIRKRPARFLEDGWPAVKEKQPASTQCSRYVAIDPGDDAFPFPGPSVMVRLDQHSLFYQLSNDKTPDLVDGHPHVF